MSWHWSMRTRLASIKDEVEKLIANRFNQESTYRGWISNLVNIKKHNKKWRMCIDFSNLNQAFSKDSFPLPWIDQLVDSTTRHELLRFMDAIQAIIRFQRTLQTRSIRPSLRTEGFIATDWCTLGWKMHGLPIRDWSIRCLPTSLEKLW